MLNSLMHCFECAKNVDLECGHRVETAANESYCCVCAGGEIDRLKDLSRWRRWPDEKPTEACYYLIRNHGLSYTALGFWSVGSQCFDVRWRTVYWMPQIPIPEDGQ